MTQEELNSYRFLSGEDPSDEMLEQIMKEVAADARALKKKTDEAYFEQLRRNVIENKKRAKEILNG